MKQIVLRAVIAVIATLAGPAFAPALAHTASTAYLAIEPAEGREIPFALRIALRDVDALLDLDANRDGRLTWGEVEDREQDIVQLARSAVTLSAADGACTPAFEGPRWRPTDAGSYLVLSGRAACLAQGRLRLDYRLFAGVDPSHRVLVRLPASDQPVLLAPGGTLMFSANGGGVETEALGLGAIFANGVLHILGGLDHLLFLVALVLPAVVERRDRRWIARLDLRAALLQVAWIATAFTAAHSITLGLASFGLVRLPASVIEPLIAVTVLAAALNILWPLVTARLALVAFGFGLIHGFGFAEVLAPLELPAFELARALLRFNLGVEVGQLVIVAVSFALLAIVRRWRGYPRWILGAGSAALAVIACAWIVERIFDLSILPV
jgi:hypothetical protein